jgi:hypothetical protein
MNMKKRPVKIIFMIICLLSLLGSFSMAETLRGQELFLTSADSGYKVIVPHFIEVKTVDIDLPGKTSEDKVIVMETPQKNSEGEYPVFEIVTVDPKAYSVDSSPETHSGDQIGSFNGNLSDGRIVYTLENNLAELNKETVLVLDFQVKDKEGSTVFNSSGLNFMFTDETTALPTASEVLVDGEKIAFEAYNIKGYNYFKLRDLAMAVNGTKKQFQVGWDGKNNKIKLTTDASYTATGGELTVSASHAKKETAPTASKLYINSKELQLTAYNIDGYNYFKLRDIAQAFDFAVTWNGNLNRVGIETQSGYTE